MKDDELKKLYTIEAFLNYGDLPKNFREGRSPIFGLHFEEIGIGENEKAHAYLSINGKLKKTKCEFIEDKNLAQNLLNQIEPKLKKLYPSISFNVRNIKSSELDYRRKNALMEAFKNEEKIIQKLDK